MNQILTRAFCQSVYRSGLLAAATAMTEPVNGKQTAGRFQILVYHRVGDTDPFVPGTATHVFERHMRYLREQFRVLSLTDLLAAAQRREVPPRAIAVTFDDGYESTYLHAYPIARRYNVPVTVYLATGLLDSHYPMWNDRIGVAIRDTSCTRLEGIPGRDPLPLTSDLQRQHALDCTLRGLKRLPPAEREELTCQISRALKVPIDRGPRMLRWQQVEEMQGHGIEFGAHTVHHPILTAVPVDEAWREIVESKQVIEERLQAPVLHFAYPNGGASDFDETTKNLVRKAGFVSAVSMVFGTNVPATDLYALRRGGPWEEDVGVFATKLWWYRRSKAATC